MKVKIEKDDYGLIIFYIMTLLSIGIIFFVFYNAPVLYTRLITEDHAGEYATFLGYAFTALIFAILGLKKGKMVKRLILLLIGFCAFVFAGEEISWGQRILGIAAPSKFLEINTQQEINIHNLKSLSGINDNLLMIMGAFLLAWLLYSILCRFKIFRRGEEIENYGIPIIRAKFYLIFLAASYFLIFYPVSKSDEIGEMYFSLAVFICSMDYFLRQSGESFMKKFEKFQPIFFMLAVILVTSLILGSLHGSYQLKHRLNLMAKRDYQVRGMNDQALKIYEYMLKNPIYLEADTKDEYKKLLDKMEHKKDR
jgi:glucan phosphoethanolaminetransferase (alkaline phosphatase superfamily)